MVYFSKGGEIPVLFYFNLVNLHYKLGALFAVGFTIFLVALELYPVGRS